MAELREVPGKNQVAYFVGERRVPDAVVQSIAAKFDPMLPEFDEIMGKLEWDNMNGCYWYFWAGMYVGVEEDGYRHT